MGRLKALPSRLSAAPSRLIAAPSGEAERLKRREFERPNWYKTARWQRLRIQALRRDQWTCCQTGALLIGKYPASNSAAVDHIQPHHWDPELFWDLNNLQSVTKQWHDSDKQRQERSGLVRQ